MAGQGRRVFRVRLKGPDANLGDVFAADLARLLLGLESCLAAAAYQASRRQRASATGRHVGPIEAATRLRLIRVRKGSTDATVAIAPPPEGHQPELGVDAATLGEQSLDVLLGAFTSADAEVDGDLAERLAAWGRDAGVGSRHECVVISAGRRRRDRAVLSQPQMQRFREISRSAEQKSTVDTVVGRLVEADFEQHTARLRLPTGGTVFVSFRQDEHALSIKDALMERRRLAGVVSYDRKTREVRRVDVQHITDPEQLMFESQHPFDHPLTAERLIANQGTPSFDFDVLPDLELSDDELAAFISAVDE